MKAKITKNYVVEYAHRLPAHEKNCRFLHGHSGGVRVVFDGPIDDVTGMVMDFGNFGWLKSIVEKFDHALVLQKTDPLLKYLLQGISSNVIPDLHMVILADGPPTAENICSYIVDLIVDDTPYIQLHSLSGLGLCSVSFEETKGNWVTIERGKE